LKEVLYADLDIDLIWKDLLESSSPSSRGWLFDNFEKDEVEGMIIPLANMANEYAQSWSKWSDFAKSSWMSAACWAIIELDEISGVERKFIKESWLRAWGEGVRPLPNHQDWIKSNHHAFAELPECQSLVEQWSLLSQSLSSSGQIKRLRL
jgi:hypothetical protein